MVSFPKNFLWGASTSAHQVEGGNHNDWSEWELAHASRLAYEAEQKFAHLSSWPSVRDQAINPQNYISGIACDHYHRFQEDLDIAKELGHNAYRFSIEWSRIEPEEGKFDEKEIEHYAQMIKALRARGMEPFVTLWHWTVPIWFQQKGGWLHSQSIDSFSRFVEKIASDLGNDVEFWCTLNEPIVFTSYGYIIGVRPPQKKSIWQAVRVFHHLARVHRRTYRILHAVAKKNNRTCSVGIAKHDKFFVSADRSLKNKLLTRLAKFFWSDAFMLHIRGYQDFVGLNYYNQDTIRFDRRALYAGLYNLSASPEGFYQTIMNMARSKKPIYILENGIDDPTDDMRLIFIREHLNALKRAMQDGADVRGYFHWSLMDNFEWENGFWPRFGLVEVNRKTLERIVRPSAWEYKKIIEESQVG